MMQNRPSPSDVDAAHRAWKRGLVEKANANRPWITEDFATVRAIVDAAPLVFGVFQDGTAPDGVGLLLVKGGALER